MLRRRRIMIRGAESAGLGSPADLPAILGGIPVRPDGPPDWPITDEGIRTAFGALLASGDWGRYHGPYVEQLTARLATLHGVPHVLLTSSGTAAVELALRGCQVAAGDEVILAGYDFKANFTNVALLGATPVLVDLEPTTAQIRTDQIATALSPRTKAILVSHLHGGLVDMHAVRGIADERGIAVIEDCCQMPLATVQGKPAGTWGDAGILSFGGSKLLTAGRGGAVVTQQEQLAQRMKLYNERGNLAYPLSEMQAAVLLPQLEQFSARRDLRHSAVRAILDGIASSDSEQPCPLAAIVNRSHLLGQIADEVETVSNSDFYKLGFWYDAAALGLTREQFCAAMRAEGIPLDSGFRSLHLIHARRRFQAADELPVATRADESLAVLHHPFLLDGESAGDQFLAALRKVTCHAEKIASEMSAN